MKMKKKKKLAYSRSYQHFQQQHFTSFCQKISSMQCVNDFLVFNWPWNVATDDFSKKRKNQMFFRGWPLKPRTYQLDQKWSNAINGCSKVLHGQNILKPFRNWFNYNNKRGTIVNQWITFLGFSFIMPTEN